MLKNRLLNLFSQRPEWLWNFLGLSFYREPWQRRLFSQHDWLRRELKRLQPDSVLEAGCGFGRNLEFLIKSGFGPKTLTGVDISRTQLFRAKKRLPRQVKLLRADALRLPFSGSGFDLVFTHGLLMHLKPADVAVAVRELVRVSRRYLVLIEEVRPRPQPLNRFTWAHDYDKIILSLPLKLIKVKKQPHQLKCYLLKKSSTAIGASLLPKNS